MNQRQLCYQQETQNGENQNGNGKNKSSINIYINKNITELNEVVFAAAKLVCEKIGVLLKARTKKKKKNQNLDGKFEWKHKEESYENRQEW